MFVTDYDSFQAALKFINENEILTYDTETTGLNVRQDTVIGFGFSNTISGFYVPILRYNVAFGVLEPDVAIAEYAQRLLQALKAKKLIMFNASFDTRMTLSNFGIDLLPSLYCDAMLLKHTCDEEFPFGLKEIATKLWGQDAKAEKLEMQASIKANGGKATEYYKADTTLLGKYCIKDCLLTARVYAHYSRELAAQGLETFFYQDEVMPLYREVTIPMESTGVALDLPLLTKCCSEISSDLKVLEANIQRAIAPHLDIFTEWFLNKDYPTQTATGKMPAWAKKGLTQQQAWAADYPGQYMFNLQSKFHLKKLFFDTLALEPLSRTPTGLPQVDEEFLASVAPTLAWVQDLIAYNKLNKLKSTYIDRLLEEQENGIFYPSFAQHRTVSGRYAGDMQQLPRPVPEDGGLVAKYTNAIRRFVIARPGQKLCSADYEQLEPTIFAHTSGDPALQEIFNAGKDFYSEVAIRTQGLAASSDKNSPDYLGKTNKLARQHAKAYALGIAYGMTGYKLKFEIGTTDEIADGLVKDYLAAFPGLAAWMVASKEQATSTGSVSSQAGRVRHLRRAKALHSKYGNILSDSLQLWKAYHIDADKYAQAKQDYREYKNLLNNAINFQVQSLAASIVNRASISIARRLKSEQLSTALVAQVHDELVFDVPEAEMAYVAEMIQAEMQNIVKLAVPLRTVPQFGSNFAECK